MAKKPELESGELRKELDKIENQIEEKEKELSKNINLDVKKKSPKQEQEEIKLAQSEIEAMGDVYLKPFKSFPCMAKFNERCRSQWEFSKQYVKFIAKHNECDGDLIEISTKPYAGVPLHMWKIPSNKPVWGPRYLAEQLKSRSYSEYKMGNPKEAGLGSEGQYVETIEIETIKQRMDALPVFSKKSVFMGLHESRF